MGTLARELRARRRPWGLAAAWPAAWLLLACSEQPTVGSEGLAGSGAGAGGALGSGAGGAAALAGQSAGGTAGTAGAALPGGAGASGAAGESASGAGGSGGASGTGGARGAGSGAGATAPGTGGAAGSGVALPSEGCGAAPAAGGSASIEVDGMARTYLVELPAGYDGSTPLPLLLGFHGAGLDGEGFRRYFDLGAAAGDEAIVVYLDALGSPTGWQYDRDIPFVDAALDALTGQYCVDEGRVFATGHSSGGYFTNALGCRRGERFRAIAPVSGGIGLRSMCEGTPAAWIAHGDADTIVPTDQGRGARDFWTEQNGCDPSSSMPVDPEPCVAYAGCAGEAPVHYCEYGGEHGPPSFGVEALWSFFRAL